MINFVTWQSAIHGFSHADELVSLRRELYPERLPRLQPRLAPRGNLHWSNLVGSWCLPFPGSDKSVMYRTQRYLYHREGARPAQGQGWAEKITKGATGKEEEEGFKHEEEPTKEVTV